MITALAELVKSRKDKLPGAGEQQLLFIAEAVRFSRKIESVSTASTLLECVARSLPKESKRARSALLRAASLPDGRTREILLDLIQVGGFSAAGNC